MPGQPSSSSQSPIRVALYSMQGAGTHYAGAGMTAYRMYSKAPPGRFNITLVHASTQQQLHDLYNEQVFLAPLGQGVRRQLVLAQRSLAWIRANANRFDVFHGMDGFNVTARAACESQRRGTPAAITLATHRADLADKGGWKQLLGVQKRRRESLKSIAAMIATSRAIEDELCEYGFDESRIVRIPYGVNIELFHPATEAEKRALRQARDWPDLPTVLFSGVIDERKRPHLLVQAMPLLRAAGHDIHAVFAGPFKYPDYEATLRAVIRECEAESRVTLLGFQSDMASLYRAADMLTLPSRAEGLPNAVLEAMASGLPAIVTAISGTVDLIDDGVQGRLIEPTPRSLAHAIRSYLDQPALIRKHGIAGRKRIEQTYSAQAVVAAHEQLFRRMMRGEPART
jgi:glycosyltransferase involved in cell wall biosynthesis